MSASSVPHNYFNSSSLDYIRNLNIDADLESSINWAYHEGSATLCYIKHPEQEQILTDVKNIMEHLNVYYSIKLEDDVYTLYLIEEV